MNGGLNQGIVISKYGGLKEQWSQHQYITLHINITTNQYHYTSLISNNKQHNYIKLPHLPYTTSITIIIYHIYHYVLHLSPSLFTTSFTITIHHFYHYSLY
ncbi:hypothetical protein OTU49_005099, partial [Cherax quadricarinatus]